MAEQDEPIRADAQLVPVGAYRGDLLRKVVAFIRDDLGKGRIADRVEAAGRAGDLSPRVRPALTSTTHFNGEFVARTAIGEIAGGHYEELRAHRSLSKDRRVFFDVSTDGSGWTVCLADDVAEQLADYISPADPNWQPITTDVQDLLEGIETGEVDGEEVVVRAERILQRRNATVAPREMAQRIEARAREWSNTDHFTQRTLLDVIEEVLRDGTSPEAYDLDRLVTRVRAIDPPEGSTVVLTVNHAPILRTTAIRKIAEDMKAAFPSHRILVLQEPMTISRDGEPMYSRREVYDALRGVLGPTADRRLLSEAWILFWDRLGDPGAATPRSAAAAMLAEFQEHPNALDAGAGAQKLRRTLHEEEHAELVHELEMAEVGSVDLEQIARELADVVYVAYGTAWAFGIDLDAALVEVHRAGMDKMRAGLRREDGKILKPPGFVPPDMTAAVAGAGVRDA